MFLPCGLILLAFVGGSGASMNNIIYEEKYVSGDVGRAKYWGLLHAILTDKKLIVNIKFKPFGRKQLVEIPLTDIRQVEIYRGKTADDIKIWFQQDDKERIFRLRSHHPSEWINVLKKLNVKIIGKTEELGQRNKVALIAGKVFLYVWIILFGLIIIGAIFTMLWKKH